MNNQWTDFSTQVEGIEAEQAVLGAVFLDGSVMDDIISSLHMTDFLSVAHGTIWREMVGLYNQSIAIDPVTVTHALERIKKLDDVGGVAYLLKLASATPTAANVRYYVGIIKRKSLKRKGYELAETIKRITDEDDFETDDEYFHLIDTVTMRMRPENNAKMRGFTETETEYESFINTKTDLIQTGFRQFDEWSGGIGRGWLFIKAGRPSVGKTANALQMAVSIARQNVGDILFWSQEMTFNQLKNRMLSPVSGVNYSRIRKKELEPHEKELLMKAHREIAKFPLFVEDSHGVTIDHIRSTARQFKRGRGEIGAIFVDYLTRMNIHQEKGQTWSRAVGEVAKRFKWLAQEVQCPVILLAQLNREGADGEPQLHHLRDSGEIEQEADIVEFLWTDPNEVSRDGVIVQSTIAKGRDTGTGRFKYLFKGWVQKYEDYKESGGNGVLPNSTTNRKAYGSRNRPA